jgi:hypothetical protein
MDFIADLHYIAWTVEDATAHFHICRKGRGGYGHPHSIGGIHITEAMKMR